jgi:putative redox protein
MVGRTASVRSLGEGLRFVAVTGSGHRLILDDKAGDRGPRPAELLLVAQAGCTAMDVLSILRKKRQPVDRYEVRVQGTQRDALHPHVFERIDVLHVVDGPAIEPEAVRRAIELSATRYCTVTGNLAAGPAEIHHAYLLRTGPSGDEGEERFREVIVTGPYSDPDALATGRRSADRSRRARHDGR